MRWLATLEHRAALFHEGGTALGVILAGEALGDEPLAQFEVAFAFGLQRLAYRDLGRTDRARRIRRDRVAVILDVAFQLIARHEPVDQPHAQSLLGGELARRVE